MISEGEILVRLWLRTAKSTSTGMGASISQVQALIDALDEERSKKEITQDNMKDLVISLVRDAKILEMVEGELQSHMRPLTYGDGPKEEAVKEFCDFLLGEIEYGRRTQS